MDKIDRPAKRRRFAVYDLEWIPRSLELRLAGLFDGERYQSFRTMRGLLSEILTAKNNGVWFYAHAGGLADVQFVLHYLIDHAKDYSIECSFSGSSAIIVKVSRDDYTWTFVDSYWLLRDSLRNIGKAIGLDKGGVDTKFASQEAAREWYTSVPLAELETYNERDCEILFRAIEEFERQILELGGQLQFTVASCAMQLFRRKYLEREIRTRPDINIKSRESYFASRVEVFSAHCESGYYYDVNSSFPFAMLKPQPGGVVRQSRHVRDALFDCDDQIPWLADVTISVPNTYIPPIPYRGKGKVLFPHGTWRSWLTGVDVELHLREGGQIEKVHEVIEFEPRFDLKAYADDIYTRRKNAESDFAKVFYKYLLNSLYGKFAERDEKQKIHINPSAETIRRIVSRTGGVGMSAQKSPGIWVEDEKVDVHHEHVPFSAQITAIARRTLYDYMVPTGDFAYCDTDGFATGGTCETSPELGGLKLEKYLREGKFYAPKVYRLDAAEVQKDGTLLDRTIVKAKGFSLGKNKSEAVEKFESLVRGREVQIGRMSRIRENLRNNDMKPKEGIITKVFRNLGQPKRCHYPDGSTRPWHISEVEKK